MSKNYNKSKNGKGTKSRNPKGRTQTSRDEGYNDKKLPRELNHSKDAFDTYKKENDPEWYMGAEELVKPATQITTFQQAGRALRLGGTNFSANNTEIELDEMKYNVPAIAVIDWIPNPGESRSPSSPINIASQLMYQQVRSKLNYLTDYAPADLAIMLYCFDSLLTLYHEIVRYFGLINVYDAMNVVWPKGIFEALGWSPAAIDDLFRNQAVYRMQFNQLIARTRSIYMPISTMFNKKHEWLASNVWKDADTAKAQLYIYRCAGYFELNETENNQGTMGKFVSGYAGKATGNRPTEIKPTIMNMKVALIQFSEMIENFRSSDSFAKIMADLLKAYDGAEVWTLPYIDETWMVEPVCNDRALNQIQNTTLIPKCLIYDYDLTQNVNANAILWSPRFETLHTRKGETPDDYSIGWLLAMNMGNICSFPMDNPTPEDIVEATRNMSNFGATYDLTTQGGADIFAVNLSFPTASSEIYVGIDFYTGVDKGYAVEDQVNSMVKKICSADDFVTAHSVSVEGRVKPGVVAAMGAFDWCPKQMTFSYVLNNNKLHADVESIGFDFNNFTVIPRDSLVKLNDAIHLSMWNVPASPSIAIKPETQWK